ncbi:MAG: flavin reductase family protein [Clostridium sp.]
MNETFTNNLEGAIEWLYKQGAFLTVKDGDRVNTMTISWGSVGYIWRTPVFMALVREERYTNEFLKDGVEYTISIPFTTDMKKALTVCGTKSGRDIDKEKVAGIKFKSAKVIDAPVVDECNKYYECKILFKQPMDLEKIDKEIVDKFYSNGNGKHILYFGEILESYNE